MSGVQVFNPATNKVEDLDAESAQAGYMAGKLHLPKAGELHLTAPDGVTTMIFPTGKVADMVEKGWSFSNPDQVATRTVEDSPLRQAGGAALGALDELTFGGAGLGARALGTDPAMLRAMKESTAGKFGSALGLGASLFGEAPLKLMGEGLSKTLLSHALAPTLAVNAAGNAIEQGAKKLLGNTLQSQALTHIAASGLGRAAENSAYGFGGALTEEAMGDADINAQHLLAGAGAGALLGGVAGVGMRGITEFRAGRAAKAAEAAGEAYKAGKVAQAKSVGNKPIYGVEAPRLTEEEFQAQRAAQGETPLPEKGVRRWIKGYHEQLDKLSALAGSDPEDLKIIGSDVGQSWLRKGKQALDDSARRMKDAINGVISEQSEVSKNYYGSLKSGALDLIPKGSDAAVLRNVGDALDRVRAVRDKAVADYAQLGFKTPEQAANAFGNLDALVDDAENRIFKSAGAGRDVVEKRVVQHPYHDREAFVQGRQADAQVAHAKKMAGYQEQLSAHEASGGEVAHPGEPPRYQAPNTDDIPVSVSREETTTRKRSLQELADSGHPLPEGLAKKAFENLEEVKRRIAKPANLAGRGEISDVAQRELETRFKDAWGVLKDHLQDTTVWGKMGDVQKDMNNAFAARQRAFDEIEKIFKVDHNGQVDPGAVHSYVSKIDKMRGDAAVDALDKWHQAQNAYADVLDKHFKAGDFGAKSRAATARYQAARKELEEGAMTFNALEREIKRRYQNYGGAGLGGGFLGAGVGAAFGPLGAVAGGFVGNQALQAVLDPGRRALNRAAFTNVLDKMQPYIDSKVAAVVRGKEAVGKAGRALEGPFGQRMVAKATLKMLEAKTPEERRKAYDERIAELQHLDDPRQFSDHVNQQLLGMHDTMPKHAAAMTRQAAAALKYIRAAIPPSAPGTNGGGGLFDHLYAKGGPSEQDIRKFAQIDQAAQDPVVTLEAAQKGYVPKHQVDAMNALYPQVAQQIQQAVVNHVGESNKPPTAAQQRTMAQLLGQSPVGAAQLKRYQSVHQQQAPKPPPATPPSSAKTARSVQTMTNSDRLETYPNRL